MANIITICRIVLSVLILFFSVFSPVFYALYVSAGITDMLDGFVARKMNMAVDMDRRHCRNSDYKHNFRIYRSEEICRSAYGSKQDNGLIAVSPAVNTESH